MIWDKHIRKDPVAAAYFYGQDGKPWPVGHLLKNPELANTLRAIAAGGADAFYKGYIAGDIAAKVASHPTNPGLLTRRRHRRLPGQAAHAGLQRLPQLHRVRHAAAVVGRHRGGADAGHPRNQDLRALAPVDGKVGAEAVHLFSEAGRLAYADRNRYAADTDFIPLPGRGIPSLLDKTYLAKRAALIGKNSMGVAKAGTPPGMDVAWGLDNAIETPSTSHLVVMDGSGAGLSMTTTVEDAFGSRQMVRGFILNNQLTDFSFDSRDADGPVANRVEPGKRPRSAMSPTIVFDKKTKKLVLAVGSPGGPTIINYVAKVLVGTLDWGLNVQQAISLPNFGSRNGPTELEAGRFSPAVHEALKARGHVLRSYDMNSGLHGIQRLTIHGQQYWFGGADPRREGVAKGD